MGAALYATRTVPVGRAEAGYQRLGGRVAPIGEGEGIMTHRLTQIRISISPYTRRQIDELREEYGTVREVITMAVHHLATAERRPTGDQYGRIESGHQAMSEGA